MGYEPYRSGQTPKGRAANLVVGAFLLVVALLAGAGALFWFDRKKLLKHVTDKDDLAVAACYVLSMQGAPEEARLPLIDAMENALPSLRAGAAKALGSRRQHDDVPFLGKAATHDPDANVRAAACEGLGVIGDGWAKEWLRYALDDPDLDVQAAACLAAGQCKALELAPFLIEKVEAQHLPLRQNAIAGLRLFLSAGEFDPAGDRHAWSDWWVRRSQR